MNSLSSAPLVSPARKPPSVNPFAKALADMEREKQSPTPSSDLSADSNKLFSDALARTGGQFNNFDFGQAGDKQAVDPYQQQRDFEAQQRQLEEQREREALRKKLHDQVNPVDTVDIFNAREAQVKKEIDALRAELKMLAVDVAKFQKEVDLTLMSTVVSPGQDGKYYITFFQKLRSFIMLLRQKIKSAATWATQMHGKSKKKKAKQGMMIGGAMHEKTSTVQDMMHHERNSAYAGG